MKSLRSHEGWLLIDHRNSPGVSDELLDQSLGGRAGMPPGAGMGVTETATYTCSHCQTVVVINPLRTRERAYCRKCDHKICDRCGAIAAANGGACKTFKQIIEETQEAAVRNEQREQTGGGGGIILASDGRPFSVTGTHQMGGVITPDKGSEVMDEKKYFPLGGITLTT